MPEVIHGIGRALLAADPAATGVVSTIFDEASAVARAQDATMLDLRVALSQAALWAGLGDEQSALVRLEAALAGHPGADRGDNGPRSLGAAPQTTRHARLAGRMPDVSADPTEALLQSLLPTLGVTRLADQTGLDVLGIPVVAAIRPNSRSVAVHQGKGMTREAARIAAVMEAAECFHAETSAPPLRRAAFRELEGAVSPERLPCLRPQDAMVDRYLWAGGIDLITGRTAWVPHELVHADYTLPQPTGSFLFEATTNGLGAGLSAAHAQAHALCETIERDAVAMWRAAGGPHDPAARAIATDTVSDPACRDLLARCAAAEVGVAIWSLPSRTGLPVFLALLLPGRNSAPGIEPEIGTGCHPQAGVALRRALLEAAQSRVTRIAGARDDFSPASYETAARATRVQQAHTWFAAAGAGAAFVAGSDDRSGPAPVLEALTRAGYDSAIWVDLDRDLPISVGRVVVPGLAGPFVA